MPASGDVMRFFEACAPGDADARRTCSWSTVPFSIRDPHGYTLVFLQASAQ